MLKKIRQVGAAAEDLEETKAFYRDVLGARFVAEFNPPGLLFFDFDGVRLMFEKGASKATLYFQVDEIQTAYAELGERGVAFDGEPHMIFTAADGTVGAAGESEWMAFFSDPGGNVLAIASRQS